MEPANATMVILPLFGANGKKKSGSVLPEPDDKE